MKLFAHFISVLGHCANNIVPGSHRQERSETFLSVSVISSTKLQLLAFFSACVFRLFFCLVSSYHARHYLDLSNAKGENCTKLLKNDTQTL